MCCVPLKVTNTSSNFQAWIWSLFWKIDWLMGEYNARQINLLSLVNTLFLNSSRLFKMNVFTCQLQFKIHKHECCKLNVLGVWCYFKSFTFILPWTPNWTHSGSKQYATFSFGSDQKNWENRTSPFLKQGIRVVASRIYRIRHFNCSISFGIEIDTRYSGFTNNETVLFLVVNMVCHFNLLRSQLGSLKLKDILV